MTSERLYYMGVGGTVATWLVIPVFQITTFAIIYGRDSELFHYFAVAMVANAYVLNTVYWVGEILDRERVKGTLVSLFLAPCPRSAWLSGFVLAGLVETTFVATFTLLFGWLVFDVRLDPNLPALLLTMPLFLLSLWGMGLVFSGIGLIVKKANAFANLVWPILMLLGGLYFPVSSLPGWLRYPARCLPVGYGLQALTDAALYDASVRDIAPDLLPLAAFAIALPILGVLAFTWIERLVRVRGELDVY
jgi:ABC-2 type transport system permease protein